ncbi:MAG: chromosomal replication initiator protein DnaA, partial [Clostridiaceae bacterium]|nr:chromosomal replication initiator protein DnaA [Clostridiaceae bacterium]
ANIATNIRELEGALKTVLYYSMLAGELSVETAQEALKDLVQPASRVKLSPDAITDVVARYYNMSIEDIKSSRRSKDVSNPRQIAMYLCRNALSMSFPEIGIYFGGRDHSTVMHACDKITNEIASQNATLIKDITGIKKRLSL